MKNSDIADTTFREAVEAIDSGNIVLLQQLLAANTNLVTKRLPKQEGYFKDPYLLWFVANNPIRHEKLPANIVEVTKIIIGALQKTNDINYQYIIDYTLGLVCTGRIPKECGVQIPLMELLINKGARVKGNVLGPIGQHNFEAANFLLEKGADYNLATAVGLNRIDDINKLIKNATAPELYVALVVASFFGNAAVIASLLKAGVDVNGSGSKEDFGGFHSHAGALHQAVFSGSLESVKLLTEAGADLNAADKVYNGTALGWAMHMQTENNDETTKMKFKEIENYLSGYPVNNK
ncbi:MAG: hypothetical protein QM737_00915 [Ferruginibacter sp.]